MKNSPSLFSSLEVNLSFDICFDTSSGSCLKVWQLYPVDKSQSDSSNLCKDFICSLNREYDNSKHIWEKACVYKALANI